MINVIIQLVTNNRGRYQEKGYVRRGVVLSKLHKKGDVVMMVMKTTKCWKRILALLLAISICLPGLQLDAYAQTAVSRNQWVLENDRLRAIIEYEDSGSIEIISFYNKTAGIEYLPQDGSNRSALFRYDYRFLEEAQDGTEAVNTDTIKTADASADSFTLGEVSSEDIEMKNQEGTEVVGKRLIIPVMNDDLIITLNFEIYNENGGMRYQAELTNRNSEKRLQITDADVIKLDFPESPHDTHYVYNMKWFSTTGGVDDTLCAVPSEDIKLILNRYKAGHGFYMSPEVNWKTLLKNSKSDGETVGKAFAGIDAFKGDAVKVEVNPASFCLVLFPGETFEYIAVNMTVFSGDIIDGKMAVEEHMRKRFQYNDTSTILNTNDWDWQGGRNDIYYRENVIPKAEKANFDMIMFDDCWNCEYYGTRDSIVPLPKYFPNSGTSAEELISNMTDFTQMVHEKGFKFGLWYSMSGGFHEEGNDLADPKVQSAKKEMIEFLIDNYGLDHQMVDLTEFFPNLSRTEYSHPTDNVYRKNVLTRNTLNEVVKDNPKYGVKYTTEVDIYPNPSNRCNELLHVVNNGWTTSSVEQGDNAGLQIYSGLFGHMPLDSLYFNAGKIDANSSMERFYGYMFSRNVKHSANPSAWDPAGIELISRFNTWRKSERVADLTEKIKHPVYLGTGWTSNKASDWSQVNGPYAMLQMSGDKNTALMLATAGERASNINKFNADLRWVDPEKDYLVMDISMNDEGKSIYQFKGKNGYNELRKFNVNLSENTSPAKAFWLQADTGEDYQLVYADEFVDDVQFSFDYKSFTVEGKGDASHPGRAFIYSKRADDVMEVKLYFDNDGYAKEKVLEFVPMGSDPKEKEEEIVYLAADLYEEGLVSSAGGSVEIESDGEILKASPSSASASGTLISKASKPARKASASNAARKTSAPKAARKASASQAARKASASSAVRRASASNASASQAEILKDIKTNEIRKSVNLISSTKEPGAYIEYEIYFPEPGIYDISVVGNTGERGGVGQWYVNDKIIGEAWDQKSEMDTLQTVDVGRLNITEAGYKKFKFKFLGGENLVLNTERFILTLMDYSTVEDMTFLSSDLFDEGKVFTSAGKAARDDGGNTAGASRYVVNFSPAAVGDYIEFPVKITVPGTYDIQVMSKINPTGRGVCDWYINDEFVLHCDQSDTDFEHVETFDLGHHTVTESGYVTFKMVCTDKADKKLNTDRFLFTVFDEPGDAKVLEDLYRDNLDRDESMYTKKSWNVLKKAMEKAAVIIQKNDPSKREIDAALKELKISIDHLVLSMLESISIVNSPVKSFYDYGEKLDLKGLEVKAYYVDGTEKMLGNEEYTISGYDPFTAGIQQILLEYEGVSAEFSVFVRRNNEEREIVSLQVTSEPDKREYAVGEELNLKGLSIIAEYDDGSAEEIPYWLCEINGFNSFTSGEKEITVTYMGKTDTFSIVVLDRILTGIKLMKEPYKTVYNLNGKLDMNGIQLEKVYSDNTTEVLSIADCMVGGFNSSKEGIYVIRVQYDGYRVEFSVEVKNQRSSSGNSRKSGGSTSVSRHSEWQKDEKGWRLHKSGSSYARSEWQQVEGRWYFFDDNSYMMSGWLNYQGVWYWLNPGSGEMAAGNWIYENNEWYYLNTDGTMKTGWLEYKGDWYYLQVDNNNGHMFSNSITPDGYTVDLSGKWVKS